MSVEAVAWALNVPVGGNQKVVLLGLANHAHHDGTGAYPSLDTLARYAHCDRSTAKRNVRKLRDAGWIIEEGRGPHGQVAYAMRMGAREQGGQNAPGGTGAPPGGALAPPEPSIEPSSSLESAHARGSDAFQRCFAYWQEKTNHPRTRPTADLRRKFQARLQDGFSEEDIRKAIDGIAAGAFVTDSGVRHDSFDLVVRNAEKLRLNMQRADAASNVRQLRPAKGKGGRVTGPGSPEEQERRMRESFFGLPGDA